MEYKTYTVSIYGMGTPTTTLATSNEDAISNVVGRNCRLHSGLKYGKIMLSLKTIPKVVEEVLSIYKRGSTFVTVREVI